MKMASMLFIDDPCFVLLDGPRVLMHYIFMCSVVPGTWRLPRITPPHQYGGGLLEYQGRGRGGSLQQVGGRGLLEIAP